MKKMHYMSVIAFTVLTLVIGGCKSSPQQANNNDSGMGKKGALPPERRDLPDFFINPPQPEDQYVGLGMAKMKDDNLSRTTALSRARADIAAQISVSVENMLTDYAQESGADGNVQSLTFVERITKEVTDMDLKGAVTKQQYPANDGTWYVMVYYPKAGILGDVQQVFARNEDAAFAEFKAQQALDRLNAELNNNPPKSQGINSPVNQE